MILEDDYFKIPNVSKCIYIFWEMITKEKQIKYVLVFLMVIVIPI